jgi:hypothetical protein
MHHVGRDPRARPFLQQKVVSGFGFRGGALPGATRLVRNAGLCQGLSQGRGHFCSTRCFRLSGFGMRLSGFGFQVSGIGIRGAPAAEKRTACSWMPDLLKNGHQWNGRGRKEGRACLALPQGPPQGEV